MWTGEVVELLSKFRKKIIRLCHDRSTTREELWVDRLTCRQEDKRAGLF